MQNNFLEFNSLLSHPRTNPINSIDYYSLMNQFPPLSSLSSNPLFSTIVTLYTLILLYFPHIFLKIIFSPVLISTAILLLSLLRLGSSQEITRTQINSDESKQTQLANEESEAKPESGSSGFKFNPYQEPNPFGSFVEWDVSAPLEVIYEAYEGEEEEENDSVLSGEERACLVSVSLDRYPSLSRYYPETDSDSSSSDGESPVIDGWDSPENICFDDGLIEISLDGERRKVVEEVELLQFEEENLIEIDISPTRAPARGEDFFGD